MASSKCCDNPPQLNPAGGEGKVIDSFGGLKAYVVGSEDCKAAVVLVSDVYGFEAPNLRFDDYYLFSPFRIIHCWFLERKIADKVSSSGYFVVVPDFLHGDPYVPGKTDRSLPVSVWVASHDPIKGFEEAKPVIAALKDKGICTVGAAGYCLGAKIVVELAKSREIQAAVLLHPTFVTVDDIKEVKCPISILGAEIDKYSPPELMKQFEIVLSANYGVSHFVKIFPGVRHGWSVRYREHDATALESAEEAMTDMMDWFHKNLKLTLKLKPSM
ncbi:hypothetical protein PR202_gb01079 [Eleusine coracana subsp. coracana]|uniref:Dienelactone hydrolase domain-containing protein n=1 Tax=Eleusine coracana subsp. coracana TaxID=191504 RepID=A0AAV5DVX8_ELECO|nr:hypothetical protein PR202_gb01079 [Eleusine coracana subsp. coracana]